ncbi:MAG: NADH-quinone oxidoreductase subunit J [Deltaproteobacteria bacterium]|jgi:NADH-quinone oxidoreductase subunit J|nr:NADH-quinone oxidoreductase subunit J [Gammaproteobacteria bacterium]MBP79364.1 NADH-quinone oxidoreductase subunit J [Deltaproteobacteria bacterium]
MSFLFYAGGAVALISTLFVILQTNVVHALIYLVLSLLAVAVVFFSLGAPFVALLEAIVYAGAIMVLFLFVVMMLNLGQTTREQEKAWLPPRVWLIPVVLATVLLSGLLSSFPANSIEVTEVGVMEVSGLLFGPYVLAVELASFLLLAGLISAYHLAKSR